MRKPIGRFSGRFDLCTLINPTPGPTLPWYLRALIWLLGGIGSPTVFLLDPDPSDWPTYTDSTGRTFTMRDSFEFDGATIPRLFWIIPGFSPWDWLKAAAFHDWFYERHHLGRDVVSFKEANDLLCEMCRTQGVYDWQIWIIGRGVSWLGPYWWNNK